MQHERGINSDNIECYAAGVDACTTEVRLTLQPFTMHSVLYNYGRSHQ